MRQLPPETEKGATTQRLPSDTVFDWRGLVAAPLVLLVFACIVVTGPLLIIAYLLQRWAASTWDWRDRWGSLRALSNFALIWYLVAGLLAFFFPHGFAALADLLASTWKAWRLPGQTTFLPIEWSTLCFRSLIALPLAPTFALLFERLQPKTISFLLRVPLPEESKTPSPAAISAPHEADPAPSDTKTAKKRAIPRKKSSTTTTTHAGQGESKPRKRTRKVYDQRALWEALQQPSETQPTEEQTPGPQRRRSSLPQEQIHLPLSEQPEAPAKEPTGLDWNDIKE